MDVQKALLERRTIHDYTDASIPDGVVDRALNAAIRAPNHKLTNPWRFTRVGPDVRQKLTDLGVELKRQKKDNFDDEYESYLREKYGNPAELIVVSQVLDDDEFRRREDYAATACAIQNLCLSLWADGVGSKWSTGSMTRHADAYQYLDIDDDNERIVGFVWVGMPKEVPDPPRDPLEDVVRTTS